MRLPISRVSMSPRQTGSPFRSRRLPNPSWSGEPGDVARKRNFAITVQGDVREGLQGATLTNELLPQLRKMEAGWHAAGDTGYRIPRWLVPWRKAQGSGAIVAGVPVLLFLTFTLLMLQLRSVSRSLLVLITGPARHSWCGCGLAAAESPLWLCGTAGRCGFDGHDSAQFGHPDRSDRERTCPGCAGLGRAIVEAAVHRLRPIVLTAAAAVLAMIPLSRSVFWGPMAVAIMGGLIVATVLTLLALPAMYAAAFSHQKGHSLSLFCAKERRFCG